MKSSAERLRIAIIALSALIVIGSLTYAVFNYLDQTKDHASSSPYYISKSTVVAEVNTDASMSVSQQQVFTLNESVSGLAVDVSNFDTRDLLSVSSVKVSSLDASGQPVETLSLPRVPFSNLWRSNLSGPGTNCYAVDTALRQIYVFFPTTSDNVMITAEYSIKEAITPYRDVAEKLWHMVEGSHSTPTYDSSVSITLPVPVTESDASDNIYAWTHGPADSSLDVSPEGVITYEVPKTDVWQYAEIRFDFPTSWLTNVPSTLSSAYGTTLRLDTIEKSESTWQDTWHQRSINSYLFDMAFLIGCLILLALSVLLYLRYGRPRIPDYKDTYWNKPPYLEEKLHPSTIGQIWRWNRRQLFDLHAALDYLVAKGAIKVEPVPGMRNEYILTCQQESIKGLRPIDKATLGLLMAAGDPQSSSVTTLQLKAQKAEGSLPYKDHLNQWKQVVQDEFDQDKYFEKQGRRWQIRLLLIALVVAASGFGMYMLFGHPVLLVGSLSTAAIMALLANYLPRRTPLGNNITARAKALRNWIKDDVPEDMLVNATELQQLMPYACLFDLKDKAITRAFNTLGQTPPTPVNQLTTEDQLWYCLYVTALLGKVE